MRKKIPLIGGIINLIESLKGDIGIIENTDVATHSISAGSYVIWHNELYKASSAISVGDALSSSNLTAVSGGTANELNNNFKPEKVTISVTGVSSNAELYSADCYKIGSVGLLIIKFHLKTTISAGSNVTATLSGINIPDGVTFYGIGYSGTNCISGHITRNGSTISVLMRPLNGSAAYDAIIGYEISVPLVDE